MVAQAIMQLIERYISRLLAQQLPIERVILYGSYARGEENKDSDIDIAIISPAYGRSRLYEGAELKRLIIGVDTRISPRPCSSLEPANCQRGTFLHDEIVAKGIVVYPVADDRSNIFSFFDPFRRVSSLRKKKVVERFFAICQCRSLL